MDLTECPICLGTFDEPQLLPSCGHSFCRRCVEGIAASSGGRSLPKCPTCRKPFRAADPKPNYALRQLLEDMAAAAPAASGGPASTPSAPQAAAPARSSCAREAVGSPVAGHAKRLVAGGVPHGLARLMAEEDRQIGLRVFVLDNSGSTAALDGHCFRTERGQLRLANCSRWEEIKAMAMEHAQWNVVTGVPCEFVLLNPGPEPRQHGRDFVRVDSSEAGFVGATQHVEELRQMLERSGPRGPTPLVDRVKELHRRIQGDYGALTERGQKVVLVLVTDGLPSDSHGSTDGSKERLAQSLKRLMSELPVYVVVRLVTDDDAIVEYYNNVDKEFELSLEVLDDLKSEAKEIRDQGNGWFAYTPMLHQIREGGTFMKLFDLLDERRLNATETSLMVQLLLRGDGEAPFPSDPHEFMQVLEARVPQEALVYDPLRNRMVAPVNVDMVRSRILPRSQVVLHQARRLADAALRALAALLAVLSELLKRLMGSGRQPAAVPHVD